MKRLVCEMCGSTDLLKQEGVFVCQSCGTKYSVEEARKMMVEGPVDVSGSVIKVDQSDKLKNLLNLARRARIENNSEEAKKYYELALIEDPTSWESAFYSMYYKLMETPIGNLKNMLPLFNNRLASTVLLLLSDNSPESPESAKAILKDLVNSTSKLYLLVFEQIIKYHAKEDSDFSMEFMSLVLKNKPYEGLSRQHSENQNAQFDMSYSMQTQLLFVYSQMMNAGLNDSETFGLIRSFCENIDSFYAGDKQLSYIRDMNAFATNLVEMQALFKLNDPNYNSKSLSTYQKSLSDRIKKLESEGHFGDAKKYHAAKNAIDAAMKKLIEEEKKKKKEQYWTEHVEEKKQLEDRLNRINQIKNPLGEQISEIQNEIDALLSKKAARIPDEEEKDRLYEKIQKAQKERASLGIFKGKEKKELSEKIEVMNAELSELEKKIEAQKAERNSQIEIDIQKFQLKQDPLTEQFASLQKDADEILSELNRER